MRRGRSLVAFSVLVAVVLAAAGVAALWPEGSPSGVVEVGPVDDVVASLDQPRFDDGFVLVRFPRRSRAEALDAYPPEVHEGLRAGVVALRAESTHLPAEELRHCEADGTFYGSAHSSRWNAVGEKLSGPAPRGLDHHRVSVDGGTLRVHTDEVVPGVAPGVRTVPSPPPDAFGCM